VKAILEISQAANQYLQAQAPWNKLKGEPEAARAILSDAADVSYLIAGLLAPVVPQLSKKLFAQLGAPPLTFSAISQASYPLLDRTRPIGTPGPLVARLEEQQVSPILGKEGEVAAPAAGATPASPGAGSDRTGEVEYSEFARMVIKVGRILSAERIPKADKLLKVSVDLGEGSPRTIVAGIAEAYQPEQLPGRNVVVVSNLKPRVLRGIESRGMLLTAGAGGKELVLVDPGSVPPGTEVK
jgi:methionyl-tRNA synthetase